MATSSVSSEALRPLLDAFAATGAAPAGGAAAALSGAVAAALLLKVCRITARGPAEAVMAEPLARLERCRRELSTMPDADAEAWGAVAAARRLGGDAGAQALGKALRHATEVPLAIARAGVEVLAVAGGVAREVRPAVVADLGVAAGLAGATVAGALLVARANVLDARHAAGVDAGFTREAIAEAERLARQAATLERFVADVIEARQREE